MKINGVHYSINKLFTAYRSVSLKSKTYAGSGWNYTRKQDYKLAKQAIKQAIKLNKKK